MVFEVEVVGAVAVGVVGGVAVDVVGVVAVVVAVKFVEWFRGEVGFAVAVGPVVRVGGVGARCGRFPGVVQFVCGVTR